MNCYLRAKVQCAKNIELQLMIDEIFTNPEFVESSSSEMPTYKCLPTPCTRDGKVAGKIAVIANDIAVEPQLLDFKNLKAFTNEDQCEIADDIEHNFEVTCSENSVQIEIQGQ